MATQFKIFFSGRTAEESTIRRCSFPHVPSYHQFEAYATKAFHDELVLMNTPHKLFYFDDEGDRITMNTQEEWEEMLLIWTGARVMKVFLAATSDSTGDLTQSTVVNAKQLRMDASLFSSSILPPSSSSTNSTPASPSPYPSVPSTPPVAVGSPSLGLGPAPDPAAAAASRSSSTSPSPASQSIGSPADIGVGLTLAEVAMEKTLKDRDALQREALRLLENSPPPVTSCSTTTSTPAIAPQSPTAGLKALASKVAAIPQPKIPQPQAPAGADPALVNHPMSPFFPYQQQLATLMELGIAEEVLLRKLLTDHKGDIIAVVESLVGPS